MNDLETYLSNVEVRRIAGGKSTATLWRWVRDGLFPAPIRIGPNSVAWRVSDCQEWAADPARWREMHTGEAEQ